MRHVEFTRIKGGDTKCINFSINIIQYRLIVERHVAQTTCIYIYTRTHVNTNALVVIKNFYEKFFYERTKKKRISRIISKDTFFSSRKRNFFGFNVVAIVPQQWSCLKKRTRKKKKKKRKE